jgi:hypothetical protein
MVASSQISLHCDLTELDPQFQTMSEVDAIAAARAAEIRAREIAEGVEALEEYADGIYDGPALMASYRGETENGTYAGYGVLTLPDSNLVLAGRFANGLLNGPGVERDMQGTVYYEGIFIDGLPAYVARANAGCEIED